MGCRSGHFATSTHHFLLCNFLNPQTGLKSLPQPEQEDGLTPGPAASTALRTAVPGSSDTTRPPMDLSYYHGPLSKTDCERLLLRDGVDGNFLLRDSESLPGALCLCVS